MAAVDQHQLSGRTNVESSMAHSTTSDQGPQTEAPPPPPPPRHPPPMAAAAAAADPSDHLQRRPLTDGSGTLTTMTSSSVGLLDVDDRHEDRHQLRRQVGLLHQHVPTAATGVGHVRQRITAATTQLEFTQAMRDFKTMFPEMDDDVIEVVLRANQGAVDATIDQLLAMSTDNENERLRTEIDASENAEAPPGYSPVTPPPTYQQAVPASVMTPSSTSNQQNAAAAASKQRTASLHPKKLCATAADDADKGGPLPLRLVKNWCPPMLGPLPADFLRIAGQWETSISNGRSATAAQRSRRALTSGDLQHRQMHSVDNAHAVSGNCMTAGATVTVTTTTLCSEVIQQKIEENELRRRLSAAAGDDDPDLARCLEDERIALFLQNEEFMSELRANRDFLSTLERDNSDSDTERPADDTSSVSSKPTPKSNADESEAVFREKLTNMGKKSKRKFAQLARLFSRQKKRGVKQMYPYARLSDGGVGSMPSRDHLLLEDNGDEDADGDYSDDDAAAGRPQNEYHSFKNSSSPSLQRCNSSTT